MLLIGGGSPMTFDGAAQATTVETAAMGTDDAGNANPQLIARGPVAAIVAVKQFGTNGGGYFGANSAHPFENPNSWTNLLTCMGIILIPVAQLVMFGKMLKNYPHAAVIFGVMLVLSLITIGWSLNWDTAHPNPALTAHPAQTYQATDTTVEGGLRQIDVSAVAGLPVDQSLGNLEGKELRFGTAAGATWAAFDHQHLQWFGQLHAR